MDLPKRCLDQKSCLWATFLNLSKLVVPGILNENYEETEHWGFRKEKIQFVDDHLPGIPFISNIAPSDRRDPSDSDNDQGNMSCSQNCFLDRAFKTNINCPVLSEKASIRFQEARGRYLVAKENIRRGEIIAVEDPIVAFPINHEWLVNKFNENLIFGFSFCLV